MGKVRFLTIGAVLSFAVVGTSSTFAQRGGGKRSAQIEVRIAALNPTIGFEETKLGRDGKIYISSKSGLASDDIVSMEAVATRGGSDIQISVTNVAAARLAILMEQTKADALAIYDRGQLIAAGAAQVDPTQSRVTIEGLSSETATRLVARVSQRSATPVGPAMLVVASDTTVEAGGVVGFDVYLTGKVSDLRAFQVTLAPDAGMKDMVTLKDVTMDTERDDFVFLGMRKLDAVDKFGGRITATLFEGGLEVGGQSKQYLGSYQFQVSPDATGSFRITVQSSPSESTLLNSANYPIAFALATSTVVEITGTRRATPTGR